MPQAGRAYAGLRNLDLAGHPHVSRLSAHIRHRLVTEAELIEAAQAAHGETADKFVSEVLWRTYWKGWLELRPGVWNAYRSGVLAGLNRIATESGLRRGWDAACSGDSRIPCFDHWAQELVTTGYLHNHARMWFASIWIFTLRLPWELGADFFLRHLVDGDPASNTLSWRWVAGLHTPGKTYLAKADNIRIFTGGRFDPRGLAVAAPPLPPEAMLAPGPVPAGEEWDRNAPAALLLHEDDLSPEFLLDRGLGPAATAFLTTVEGRSPRAVAPAVVRFAEGARADVAARLTGRLGAVTAAPFRTAEALSGWARDLGVKQVVAPHAPVGPAADILTELSGRLDRQGQRLVRVLRRHDATFWPHATHGFFRFREDASTKGIAVSG